MFFALQLNFYFYIMIFCNRTEGAHLVGADFSEASLKETYKLTIDQLSDGEKAV